MKVLYKKNIIMVVLMVLMFSVCVSSVVAADAFINNTGDRITSAADTQIGTIRDNVWGSIKLVLQILALSAILACGVRYMFASADQKADIKKSLTAIVIGAVLVFGTTLITDFIIKVSGEVLKVR